jgi:uracil-DNA glycosylase
MDIKSIFAGVDKKWIRIMTSSTMMPLLSKVLNNLKKEPIDAITPAPTEMFNFARLTPYDKVKIVIIGQDPYPKQGDAHGLSFSSLSAKVPASLKNIYKCLDANDLLSGGLPTTSNLSGWASQGVLLLNTSLTTRVGESNAHAHIWKDFTTELIRLISTDNTCGPGESLIFMLWGLHAKKCVKVINDDCVVYEWSHPSPLAQNGAEENKFIHCDHFTEANMVLEDVMDLTPIEWDPVPTHVIFTDGACSNNGKGAFSTAGFSTYFDKGPFKGTVMYGRVPPMTIDGKTIYGTNQRGEGLGILTALEVVVEQKIACNVKLITDSNFWKDMIETWMPNWVAKGVDFNDKKNPDLTVKLNDMAAIVSTMGNFEIIHVNSHGKNKNAPPAHVAGNQVADDYAVIAKTLTHFRVVTTTV